MQRLHFLCLSLLLYLLPFSAISQEASAESPTLNVAIGFRLGLLMDPNLESSFEVTKEKILQYGIDEVRIYGGGNAITYRYLGCLD